MKKKFAGILAALMVLMMGTTVFAADSPNSSDQLAEKYRQNITQIDSSSGTVTLATVTGAVKDEAQQAIESVDKSGEIMALADVVISEDTDVSKGVTLTFYVSGISKGDNVYALHQKQDGTWETCNTVVGDGYVKVTLYSLSPVAIAKYASGTKVTPNQQIPNDEGNADTGDADQQDNTINNTTTNNVTNNTADTRTSSAKASTATSPRTGVPAAAYPVIAILAITGIVLFGKKARA